MKVKRSEKKWHPHGSYSSHQMEENCVRGSTPICYSIQRCTMLFLWSVCVCLLCAWAQNYQQEEQQHWQARSIDNTFHFPLALNRLNRLSFSSFCCYFYFFVGSRECAWHARAHFIAFNDLASIQLRHFFLFFFPFCC